MVVKNSWDPYEPGIAEVEKTQKHFCHLSPVLLKTNHSIQASSFADQAQKWLSSSFNREPTSTVGFKWVASFDSWRISRLSAPQILQQQVAVEGAWSLVQWGRGESTGASFSSNESFIEFLISASAQIDAHWAMDLARHASTRRWKLRWMCLRKRWFQCISEKWRCCKHSYVEGPLWITITRNMTELSSMQRGANMYLWRIQDLDMVEHWLGISEVFVQLTKRSGKISDPWDPLSL